MSNHCPVAPILFSLLLVPLQTLQPKLNWYVNFILEKSLNPTSFCFLTVKLLVQMQRTIVAALTPNHRSITLTTRAITV